MKREDEPVKLVAVCIALEEVGPCGACGARFAIDRVWAAALRRTAHPFYCPNGHELRFPKVTP